MCKNNKEGITPRTRLLCFNTIQNAVSFWLSPLVKMLLYLSKKPTSFSVLNLYEAYMNGKFKKLLGRRLTCFWLF